MPTVLRFVGYALIVFAVVFAVQFVMWRVYESGENWAILNPIGIVAVGIALLINARRKLVYDRDAGAEFTREFLEANTMLYSTILLAALYLFNSLNLWINGYHEVNELVMHDINWVIVDVATVVIVGTTGRYLVRTAG